VDPASEDHVAIHWPDERPGDWTEWETIIRDTTRHWVAPVEVAIERQGSGWRVASTVLCVEPRQPAKDNQRRHRVTEALRARGKPAGLGGGYEAIPVPEGGRRG
jgi:hypothetical protein